MWGCLFKRAILDVNGFKEAFMDGRIACDIWEECTAALVTCLHYNPHPMQVARACIGKVKGLDVLDNIDYNFLWQTWASVKSKT